MRSADSAPGHPLRVVADGRDEFPQSQFERFDSLKPRGLKVETGVRERGELANIGRTLKVLANES